MCGCSMVARGLSEWRVSRRLGVWHVWEMRVVARVMCGRRAVVGDCRGRSTVLEASERCAARATLVRAGREPG